MRGIADLSSVQKRPLITTRPQFFASEIPNPYTITLCNRLLVRLFQS